MENKIYRKEGIYIYTANEIKQMKEKVHIYRHHSIVIKEERRMEKTRQKTRDIQCMNWTREKKKVYIYIKTGRKRDIIG